MSSLPIYTLRCDGGSRGNPGPGAVGYVLCDASGAEVEAKGIFLGVCTNNVAEYRSLIEGLGAAARHGVRELVVRMDSELVVRQMLGQYKVKNEGLKPLHAEAKQAVMRVGVVRFESVPRDDNGRADGLVNEALDAALRR
ncbi:MAG: ribonuclease HI family protein [Candidatus Eisenbacteria bacterium]|nr:ribonuclease HI family protein [Candidatus Eisenbacteria bacterium]